MGEVFKIIDGDRGKNYPNENDFYSSGHTLFLDTGNVQKSGFNFNNLKFINKEKDEMLKNGKLQVYDFILTSRGTLGNVAYYSPKIQAKYSSIRINSAMLILRPISRNSISDSLMTAILGGKIIEDFMSKNHVGSAQPHITKRDFSKLNVYLPSKYEEQEQLGMFILEVDKTITLLQRKINNLNKVKKGLLQKLFPAKQSINPRIRFNGFNQDWEQRQFSELVNKLSKTSASSSLPKIEFEDIISGEGRLNKDVSTKFDNRKGILFNENNILYGKLRPYLKNWLYTDFKGIALGDFWVFEANYIEPKFLYFLIQADIYQKAANDTSGTKMPRSDWQKVSSTKFYVPRDLEEQIKIGNLLMGIEETITLLQKELEMNKQIKKGFLQKLFPKE